MPRAIPQKLQNNFQNSPESRAWLERLPTLIADLESRWELSLGEPFDGEQVSCSWVAPATRADGSTAIFKIGWPHMEAEHEIAGLKYWAGDGVVRVFEADEPYNAYLMERCEPGTLLKTFLEPEQDAILARMLKRLWRKPEAPHPFRHLSEMLGFWSEETRADEARWSDPGLVRLGLSLFEHLSRPSLDDVLLATDLHAGNILAAQREPWLVIDPKPFVGDRAYEGTQHLLYNCTERLRARPNETILRFADLADLDSTHLTLWLFARAAADPRDDWSDLSLARVLAP